MIELQVEKANGTKQNALDKDCFFIVAKSKESQSLFTEAGFFSEMYVSNL